MHQRRDLPAIGVLRFCTVLQQQPGGYRVLLLDGQQQRRHVTLPVHDFEVGLVRRQEFHRCRVASGDGEVQGCCPGLVDGIHAGALPDQCGGDIGACAHGCPVQGGHTVFISQVNGDFSGKQCLDHLDMTAPGGQHQGGLPVPVSHIGIHTMLQQRLDDFRSAQ